MADIEMQEVIDYLNANAGAFTVFFTAVVTLATVVYAALTWILVSETRKMRKAQTDPRLELIVEPYEFSINIVRLRLRNIGAGPACDLRIKSNVASGAEGAEKLLEEFTSANFFKKGLAYLGPGEVRHSHFTQMAKNYDAKIASILKFDINYAAVSGNEIAESFVIDMSELKGLTQLGTPNLHSIAKSLEKLQEQFANALSGHKKIQVSVFNAEDRAKERLEHEDFINESRNQL
jgi:hypothetical protein